MLDCCGNIPNLPDHIIVQLNSVEEMIPDNSVLQPIREDDGEDGEVKSSAMLDIAASGNRNNRLWKCLF